MSKLCFLLDNDKRSFYTSLLSLFRTRALICTHRSKASKKTTDYEDQSHWQTASVKSIDQIKGQLPPHHQLFEMHTSQVDLTPYFTSSSLQGML